KNQIAPLSRVDSIAGLDGPARRLLRRRLLANDLEAPALSLGRLSALQGAIRDGPARFPAFGAHPRGWPVQGAVQSLSRRVPCKTWPERSIRNWWKSRRPA